MLAQNVVTEEIYRHGYSFKNPGLIRYPLSAIGPKAVAIPYGPARVMEDKKLRTRRPVWLRRNAKAVTNAKLGIVGNTELSGFGEVATGTKTVNTAPVATTNFWGALSSVLTSGAGYFTQQQQVKLTQAQAELTAQISALEKAKVAAGGMNWPMILGIGGGALLITALIVKRRKR